MEAGECAGGRRKGGGGRGEEGGEGGWLCSRDQGRFRDPDIDQSGCSGASLRNWGGGRAPSWTQVPGALPFGGRGCGFRGGLCLRNTAPSMP